MGNGTIKLQQSAPAVETFTGPIEIQEGSIKLTGIRLRQITSSTARMTS